MRPMDVGLVCAVGAAVLLLAVDYARTSSIKGELVRSRAELNNLAKENASLRASVQGLEREMRDQRLLAAELAATRRRLGELEESMSRTHLDERAMQRAAEAAVEAALQRRIKTFMDDINRRIDEIMARLAREVDVKGLETELRRLAEGVRSGQSQVEPPKSQAQRPQGRAPASQQPATGMDAAITKGLDGLADGLVLWREFREGRISQEEFEKRRKELEERVRTEIEKSLTPEDRARIEEMLKGR